MKSHIFSTLMKDIAKNRLTRGYIVRNFDKYLYDKLINNNNCHLQAVQERKYYFLRAMLHKAVDNLEKGYFSEDMYRNIVDVLVEKAFLGRAYHRDNLEAFRTEYGMLPPTFIVLSPTQACNLNCPGCYASSDPGKSNTLPFHIVDRIIRETRDKFHSRFVTISGGEPFLYKSDGKTLLDIFEKYDDMFFLVYTNGSLITPEIAHRLKESANVTPAISVEGFEQETDQRRGKGTHKNILKAFGNLRQAGVPFGISVTATSNNADILLGNEFYEEYFDRQGAIYMWQFQLMPIGRSHHAFQQMVPAEKRVQLYRKWEELIMEKEYCVADFWNSGVLTNGCIAYGRGGGYLHIDWNGNIMPCVFVPYYVDNVYDLYENGKTLVDALFSDYMKRGRRWIHEYALNDPENPGNLLMPCSIRDHYANFRNNILTADARPENEPARISLNDEQYYNTLVEYDQALETLTADIWETEFKNNGQKG